LDIFPCEYLNTCPSIASIQEATEECTTIFLLPISTFDIHGCMFLWQAKIKNHLDGLAGWRQVVHAHQRGPAIAAVEYLEDAALPHRAVGPEELHQLLWVANTSWRWVGREPIGAGGSF